MSSGSTLADKAKAVLGECSRILVFDESGNVMFSTFQVGQLKLRLFCVVLRVGLVATASVYCCLRISDPAHTAGKKVSKRLTQAA